MKTRTHTIRLFPDKAQEEQLLNLMRLRNRIWNDLLQIKEKHYQDTKKSMSDFQLINCLPKLKKDNPEFLNYNAKAAQSIAQQIGAAYRSFFKRQKNGDKTVRLPRPVDEEKIISITFNQSGWIFKESEIKISKIGVPIPFRSKEEISNLLIKEIRIKLCNQKWLCDLVVEYYDDYEINTSNKVLAIDLGLKRLATGIDSDGNVIRLNNKSKKISKYFGRKIAKISARIGSHNDSRRKQKLINVRNNLYNKKNAQVKQTLHIQSKQIANMKYHTVVLGDLSVKELMNKINNKRKGVRKSFQESSIDTFRRFLSYKCQGRTDVIEIDERHTTQLNCLTGKKFEDKIELKDREVKLADGMIIDRDLNSAINIYKRWESYHLAAMTPPLDISNVLKKNNLFEKAKQEVCHGL